jgi:sulfate adenylyltransferase subunit 1 (EFTu-like GTPase family)
MSIRTRITAGSLKVGDTLLTQPGAPTVTRVMPTKKGDKVQVYAGQAQPLVLDADKTLWITHAPVSQA